jgi:hypothetical protein
MKRSFLSVIVAAAATLAQASATFAQPISEPASCNGYLSSWANPNNGFIIQELVRPAADELGVTVGSLRSGTAQLHLGGLEPCIP